MADLKALFEATGAGGLTVVIPAPHDVIQSLMKVKSDMEKHKNGERAHHTTLMI